MSINKEKLRNPVLRDFTEDHLDYACRMPYLGTPVLADVDRVVTTANMKVGAYTIAAQPDVVRNITVSHTQVGGVTDTLGTIVVVGTNIKNEIISETITPLNGTIANGLKAFKTITTITGVGWVIDTTADTITIGVGTVLGLPMQTKTGFTALAIVGTAIVISPTLVNVAGAIDGCTIDASSGTYDGSKKVYALLVE